MLCDDLGYGDLGCYGHPHIRTPNLDALAGSGMKMTACYSAAPVCSPSRVGLLTGRSPNRAGVFDWIPEASRERPDRRDRVHMRDDEVTIADCLGQAGYQTAMVGKWHCNSRFNDPAQPQPGDAGFDHWMATQNNASPSHENPKNFVRNGDPVGPLEGYSCQLVMDESLRWLDACDSSRPFFLFAAFHEPHEPVASPPQLVDRYAGVAESDDQAQYFANVTNVDDAVGRLVDYLDEHSLRDNTLIFFTSDNGPETLNRYRKANRSHGSPGPLRGMKLHTTDAGFRVCGIASWPAEIEAGTIEDRVFSSLDLMPTLCGLAAAKLPDRELDGIDWARMAEDPDAKRDSPLVWAYYNALNERRVAMRIGDFKVLAKLDGLGKLQNVHEGNHDLVRSSELTDFQIFNVQDDIDEDDDLSGSLPYAPRLKQRLIREYERLLAGSHVW